MGEYIVNHISDKSLVSKTIKNQPSIKKMGNFPGGPLVKNQPSNAVLPW